MHQCLGSREAAVYVCTKYGHQHLHKYKAIGCWGGGSSLLAEKQIIIIILFCTVFVCVFKMVHIVKYLHAYPQCVSNYTATACTCIMKTWS